MVVNLIHVKSFLIVYITAVFLCIMVFRYAIRIRYCYHVTERQWAEMTKKSGQKLQNVPTIDLMKLYSYILLLFFSSAVVKTKQFF